MSLLCALLFLLCRILAGGWAKPSSNPSLLSCSDACPMWCPPRPFRRVPRHVLADNSSHRPRLLIWIGFRTGSRRSAHRTAARSSLASVAPTLGRQKVEYIRAQLSMTCSNQWRCSCFSTPTPLVPHPRPRSRLTRRVSCFLFLGLSSEPVQLTARLSH